MSARLWVHTLENPPQETMETCCITPLPLDDAAKISALAELFPQQSAEELISSLLHHALHELNASDSENLLPKGGR